MRAAPRLRLLSAALFFLVAFAPLVAQKSPNADALAVPEEAKSENPLLRLEIVSLGSYPITLFYVGFIYDIKRYYDNGRDSAYAPWPFRGSNAVPLDNSERMTRLGAALGISLSVGIIDAVIHASKVKKAKRLREAKIWAKPEEEGP
jgi:hypothetical protein